MPLAVLLVLTLVVHSVMPVTVLTVMPFAVLSFAVQPVMPHTLLSVMLLAVLPMMSAGCASCVCPVLCFLLSPCWASCDAPYSASCDAPCSASCGVPFYRCIWVGSPLIPAGCCASPGGPAPIHHQTTTSTPSTTF